MRTPFSTTSRWMRSSFRVAVVLVLLAGVLGLAITQAATASTPIPLISITAVEKDNTVTIKTTDFPANRTFVVHMGAIGTLGIGGTEVGTTFSGTGGTFTATYSIPDNLKGQSRIAIRLDSTTGGYKSWNWFWNDPSKGASPGAPAYSGIPTFTISVVVKDSTVTIKTKNFPANKTFVVRMGKFGTLGVGGVEVGTTETGPGGTFTISYPIPDSLKGQSRIAIRLDATTGGYKSWNWFWNK